MLDPNALETIRQVAEPICAADSVEIVELSTHRQGGQLVVRFLIDKPGGVTVRDCAQLNQHIGQALDEAGTLTERYTLEVSSPGLDRPLTSKRDFERALGERVDLQLREPIEGARQIRGTVLAVQPEALVVTTSAGNITIPLEHIQHAKKALQW